MITFYFYYSNCITNVLSSSITGTLLLDHRSPHMAKMSISRHVIAICCAILDMLQPLELPMPKEEDWKKIAKRFGDLWDYLIVIGALHGKHTALEKPANSGSLFYNYKEFPSVVLMVLSNVDPCFILVDGGQYGWMSDA